MRKLLALALFLPALALAQVHGRGGGATIGGSIAGTAPDKSVVIVHPANVLATDSNLTYDPATDILSTGTLLLGGAGSDTFLVRDAANIPALRNGTNAQNFRVYGTFTDSSNYERVGFLFTSGIYTVMQENAGTGSARPLGFGVSGSVKWELQGTTGHFLPVTNNAVDLGSSGQAPRNLYLGSSVKQVGGVASSGVVGVPVIVATGRATAQSAANASISTFTVGASDASFEVSANMNVTASTSLATTLSVTYTDESNTSRTMILPIQQLSGTFVAAGAITGTGAWESPVMHIRCKAATTITIFTSAGTFTGVTYTAEGIIKQTA